MTHPLLDVSIRHKPWAHKMRDIQNILVSIVGITLEKVNIDAAKQELSIVLADMAGGRTAR